MNNYINKLKPHCGSRVRTGNIEGDRAWICPSWDTTPLQDITLTLRSIKLN